MTTIQRFDSVPIRDPIVDKQTGFLNVKRVPIAQAMVQKYRKADGSYDMEAKLPEYILSDSTVQSANNKPVTDNHPGCLVTKENSKQLMKGFTTSNAHVEGNMLFNDVTITDADMIDKIKHGKRELSIGFETEVSPESGEFNGVKYDSVQKNIRINHVAVVDRGRAGHNVRLLGDSAEAVVEDKGESMADTTKIRVDGADVTVASQDADKIMKLDADNEDKAKQIADLKAKIADLTNQLNELQGKNKDAQAEVEKAKAKADSAEADKEKIKKEFDSFKNDGLDNKLALISKVKRYVHDDNYDFHGKSDRDMKIDAVKAIKGDAIDFTEKPDTYVDAAFDLLGAEKQHHINGYGGQEVKGDSAIKEDADEAQKLLYDRYHLAENLGKED